jgi:serine/threonine-protein kinase PpkA
VSAIEIPGYKIIRTLGVGGQATVYLAIQTGFEREVALKVMSPILAADPTFGERFIREAKIVAKLAHKNIVTVYDAGESGNFYYLAMEFMPGGDLKRKIDKGMKARECLSIIGKISTALHFAHDKGYIHRDVKSENILFNEEGEPFLTDFGIAKASNSTTQMTQTGKLIGTPEYMSPEQCRGKTIDGRSDLYSLGIILFEMLTRKVPFSGEDSVSVCIKHVTQPLPVLPVRLKHFQWLLGLLLAKDPEDRFQTGIELTKAVEEFKNTGQKTTDIGKNKVVRPKPTISKTVTNSDAVVNEVNSGADFIDDLHTDKRSPNLTEKPKSLVKNVVVAFIMITIITAGYLTKDLWLEKSYQWVDSNFLNQSKANDTQNNTIDNAQNLSENGLNSTLSETKSNNSQIIDDKNEQSIIDRNLLNNTPGETNQKDISALDNKAPNVSELLEEADRLVQYTPRELADIKQALNLIATIDTMEPENKSSKIIYQNILSYSLEEATKLANQNDFEKASEWTALVEYKQPDYVLLGSTKQNIERIKTEYDSKETERVAQQQQIKELIVKAEIAIEDNRLSSPAKRNAVHYYQNIIQLDERNEQALKGLEKVEMTYISMIEKSIDNKAYTKSKSLLAKLTEISDNDVQHNNLRQKIAQGEKKNAAELKERRRLDAIVEEKKKAELVRKERLSDPLVAMQLKGGLNSANKLEADMMLVSPENNNAKDKYMAVLKIDDRNEEAIAGLKRIEQTIISQVKDAVTVSDRKTALEWLQQLRIFDPEHHQILPLENSVISIKEVEEVPDLIENTNEDTVQVEDMIESQVDNQLDKSTEAQILSPTESQIETPVEVLIEPSEVNKVNESIKESVKDEIKVDTENSEKITLETEEGDD